MVVNLENVQPVQSEYLPLNGNNDLSYKYLNLSAIAGNGTDENEQITIMWTRTSFHDNTKTFTPNHFAPLIKKKSTSYNRVNNTFA